jgi:hypothetical protein
MKKLLLILMVLASTAMAGDAKIKALLIGTWENDDGGTMTFTSDGKWQFDDDSEERWDVRSGKLIEIRPAPESERYYTIISLTKHRCVIQEDNHGRGRGIWTRE